MLLLINYSILAEELVLVLCLLSLETWKVFTVLALFDNSFTFSFV